MAYVYSHPSSQFRPLRNAGEAPYHTSITAGISTVSHLIPAKSATTPNETNRIDQPIDFLEFALINSYPALVARLELSAFPVSPTLPHFFSATLSVHFFLIPLEADARDAQADHC